MSEGINNYMPLWGEWFIEKSIGKGSYGEVFKVYRDVNGTREYAAVKYISIPKEGDKDYYKKFTAAERAKMYDDRADKLSIEVSSMLNLRNAHNIVRYEDHIKTRKPGKSGWDIIIRMELLTALEDHLARNAITAKDVAKLGIDICSAIESCQQFDIIHRDIKIENIFIDAYGNYKLGDFGVSKIGSGTATGTVTGTEDYMAPEITRDHKYNKTVDIYALGIAMYQLLNNRRKPYIDADSIPGQDAEAQAHLKRLTGSEPMPAPKYCTDELARVVLKACAYDRHDRFDTPREMMEALRTIYMSLPDTPVLLPREIDDYDDLSDDGIETGNGGSTISDVISTSGGGTGGGTISDVIGGGSSTGGGTISDVVGGGSSSGGGTISDVAGGGSSVGGGTISDIHTTTVTKKKSKLPIIIIAALLSLLLIGGVSSYFIFSDDADSGVSVETIANVPAEYGMIIGETYELEPMVLPEDADADIEYSSSDEDVATVSPYGTVEALAEGETTITVSCGGVEVTMYLTVTADVVEVTGITGDWADASMTVGDSMTLRVAVEPADATNKEVTYSSSDDSVATVDEYGNITAVSAGTATITVTADGGVYETKTITVKKKQTSSGNRSGGNNNSGGTQSGGQAPQGTTGTDSGTTPPNKGVKIRPGYN